MAKARLYSLQGPMDFINGIKRPLGGGRTPIRPCLNTNAQTAATRTPRGSVPQPHQQFASIHPLTDSGKGSVLHQELTGHRVKVSDGMSEGEGDRAVGVCLIQNVFREGHHEAGV